MRSLVALLVALLVAACAGDVGRTESATPPPSPDPVVSPAPPAHATVEADAATSLPPLPSVTSDAPLRRRDDAGGESIGVTDRVTIFVMDPED